MKVEQAVECHARRAAGHIEAPGVVSEADKHAGDADASTTGIAALVPAAHFVGVEDLVNLHRHVDRRVHGKRGDVHVHGRATVTPHSLVPIEKPSNRSTEASRKTTFEGNSRT